MAHQPLMPIFSAMIRVKQPLAAKMKPTPNTHRPMRMRPVEHIRARAVVPATRYGSEGSIETTDWHAGLLAVQVVRTVK